MTKLSRQRRGGCQPGATPRVSCPSIIVRPERAGDSCAPSGRTTIDQFWNPGRCPGLASTGAFSAGI